MRNKLIAPVVVGGLLLGGLALATPGVAAAATPTDPSATHATKGDITSWVRSHRKEIRKAGVTISAKTIGVTPQVLVTDLKAGNSIAGVATQHGVSPQTVVNALVSAADSRINQAVTNGKLTAAEASVIEARLPARVTKAVDHVF